MRKLNLYQLADGVNGISPSFAILFGEAAQVCLEKQGYSSGVILKVTGLYNESIILEWSKVVDQNSLVSWQDEREATEYGATAIALLLMMHLGNFTFFERLAQGQKGDFFLKKNSPLAKKKKDEIYLEISGIFKEEKGNTVNGRISKKKKIIEKKEVSDDECWIIVIEFNTPKAKISKI